MVESRRSLIQEDPLKSNVVFNYRPIPYLKLILKLLPDLLAEKRYEHLGSKELLLEEQGHCMRKAQGLKNQLLIDEREIQNCLTCIWHG